MRERERVMDTFKVSWHDNVVSSPTPDPHEFFNAL